MGVAVANRITIAFIPILFGFLRRFRQVGQFAVRWIYNDGGL